jgi:hypothetical protein
MLALAVAAKAPIRTAVLAVATALTTVIFFVVHVIGTQPSGQAVLILHLDLDGYEGTAPGGPPPAAQAATRERSAAGKNRKIAPWRPRKIARQAVRRS